MTSTPRVITITVTRNGNGWNVTTNPDPADVYADETIVWDVKAPDDASVAVKIVSVTTPAPKDPFTNGTSGPIKGNDKIRAKLKKGCFAPVYKYEIWIDNSYFVDPDIQIKEK